MTLCKLRMFSNFCFSTNLALGEGREITLLEGHGCPREF